MMEMDYNTQPGPADNSPVEGTLLSIQHSLERLAHQVDRAQKAFAPVLTPSPPTTREDGSGLEVVGSALNHRLRSFDVQIHGLANQVDELVNRSEL